MPDWAQRCVFSRKKGVLEILRITVDAPAALVRTLEEFIGPTAT